jgi:hypothetical protein
MLRAFLSPRRRGGGCWPSALGSGIAALDAKVVNIAPDAGGAADHPGAAARVVFLSGITFAFIEAPAFGWSPPAVLAMALAGVTGLAVFLN